MKPGNVRVVELPTFVITPGGNVTDTIYVDDRPGGQVLGFPQWNGVLNGDGTWVYFETNGLAGLQRGGASDLPPTPVTGHDDCTSPPGSSDEMLLGVPGL